MKQAARKIPAANRLPGRMDIARFTVASTAPIALAVWAKAPARMKINTISMILLLAAPGRTARYGCLICLLGDRYRYDRGDDEGYRYRHLIEIPATIDTTK